MFIKSLLIFFSVTVAALYAYEIGDEELEDVAQNYLRGEDQLQVAKKQCQEKKRNGEQEKNFRSDNVNSGSPSPRGKKDQSPFGHDAHSLIDDVLCLAKQIGLSVPDDVVERLRKRKEDQTENPIDYRKIYNKASSLGLRGKKDQSSFGHNDYSPIDDVLRLVKQIGLSVPDDVVEKLHRRIEDQTENPIDYRKIYQEIAKGSVRGKKDSSPSKHDVRSIIKYMLRRAKQTGEQDSAKERVYTIYKEPTGVDAYLPYRAASEEQAMVQRDLSNYLLH